MMNRILSLSALTFTTFLAMATQANTLVNETIDLKSIDGKTTLVLVKNGETKKFALTSAELADPAALDKLLAEIPETERDKMKQLLQNAAGNVVAGLNPTDHKQVIIKRLGQDGALTTLSDVDLKDGQVIIQQFQTGKAVPFEVIKQMLQATTLDKTQLQELQAIIDSKF